MYAERLADNPIIVPAMDDRMGDNVNGPSLIRVPNWVSEPLGRYYLYFAHHDGRYIRLAYSDALSGPWRTYRPGVLALGQTPFAGHVASPDVHVDHRRRQIRLYYHGSDTPTGGGGAQSSRVALSADGLHFTRRDNDPNLGEPYLRMFRWQGMFYGLAMPGIFYRSADGLSGFVTGPTLFSPAMRHSAVAVDGDHLTVIYSNVGDCPERLLWSRVALTPDWRDWRATEPVTLLAPERDYEGAGLSRRPSARGMAEKPVCQLRDPALFGERGARYLLYAVAGEHGIAIARLYG